MEAFPLIYSRILKDDYPHGFLVRPSGLDAEAALKYVIPAMENIQHTDGLRHTVFPAGDYLIYGGVACVADRLVERILQIRAIDFPYAEYLSDKAGRPLIFFIGFAMRKDSLPRGNLPDMDLYETYRIYLSYLKKQWREDKAKTDFSEPLELNARRYDPGAAPQCLAAGGKRILRNFCEEDFQKTADYCFAGMAWSRGDFSFLSHVLPEDAAKSPFAYISAYGCTPEECASRIGTSAPGIPPSGTQSGPKYPNQTSNPGTSAPGAPPSGTQSEPKHPNQTSNPCTSAPGALPSGTQSEPKHFKKPLNILDTPIAGASDDLLTDASEAADSEKKTNRPPRRRITPATMAAWAAAIAVILLLLLLLQTSPGAAAEASPQNQMEQTENRMDTLKQIMDHGKELLGTWDNIPLESI